MSYIGINIKNLRKERNMSQEKLAKMLNVSYQAVSKWENETADPDILLMPQIAEVFGVTVDNLFDRDMKGYRNLACRLGSVFEQKRSVKNFMAAEAESRKLMDSGKADDEDLRLRGILFEQAAYECYNEAIRMYELVLNQEKMDDTYYQTQAQHVYLLYKMNLNNENIRKFEKKIVTDPKDMQNYCMLSISYVREGYSEKGWEIIQKALEQEPQNAYVLHYAGLVLSALGKSEDAIQYWKLSYEYDSDLLANLYSIAEEYEKQTELEKSTEIYVKIRKWLIKHGFDLEAAELEKRL